jgi:hypothetical protein
MLKSLPGSIGIAVSVALSLTGATGAHALGACAQESDCLTVVDPTGFTRELLVDDFIAEPNSGSQFVYTFGVPIPIDTSQFDYAIMLTDASGDSDIVGIAHQGSAPPVLGFSSEVEGTPLAFDPSVWGAAPAAVIPEPGGPINISQFLLPTAVAQGWSATFQSDIPEPSTWVMMLLGFAGLGFAGYRSTQKSTVLAA